MFEKKVLPNGLRVVAVPMPNSLTTTVLVLTETGSKYEAKRINGVSHFLEHLCFKGTKKRPTERAVSEELDGLGAKYNAFTGHEYTGYYAKAERRHFEQLLDVVSDVYLNPAFPAKELEKERGVIVGEIEMYEDMPQRAVADLFTDLLYGDQPAGWNIAGTKKSVRAISRRDVISYKQKHYVAPATVVVVSGKCRPGEVFRSVARAFRSAPRTKKFGKQPVKEAQNVPRAKVRYKKTSQSHLVLGFRTCDIYHETQPVLDVLSAILGGGMSSRLFLRVRAEMGAGYYVGADNDAFTDHGFLAAFAGVDNGRVKEVISAILDETEKLKTKSVSREELEKVKNYLVGGLFSGLETSSARANFYGDQEVHKLFLKTPREKAEEFRAVSAQDVRDAANDIFKNEKLNLALIGPFKRTASFKHVLHVG